MSLQNYYDLSWLCAQKFSGGIASNSIFQMIHKQEEKCNIVYCVCSSISVFLMLALAFASPLSKKNLASLPSRWRKLSMHFQSHVLENSWLNALPRVGKSAYIFCIMMMHVLIHDAIISTGNKLHFYLSQSITHTKVIWWDYLNYHLQKEY